MAWFWSLPFSGNEAYPGIWYFPGQVRICDAVNGNQETYEGLVFAM